MLSSLLPWQRPRPLFVGQRGRNGKLTFNACEVAPLVEQTLSTQPGDFRPTYDDLFDPKKHLGGKIKKKNGWPDQDNIDRTKILPALWLVKDQGVYLMSNGKQPEVPKGASLPVAYADESNPKKPGANFDDWYEAARDIMGGDDCVISLPIEWFEKAVKDGREKIRLKVMKTKITLLDA